jgi:hypothetical protein
VKFFRFWGYALFSLILSFSVLSVPAFSQPRPLSALKAWEIPHDALFFKNSSKTNWADRAEEEREWLAPAGLTPDVFKAVDNANLRLVLRRGAYEQITAPADEKRIQQEAFETLKPFIKAEWLPALSLVKTGRMNLTSPRPSYEVAHCSFERGDVRGVYMTLPRQKSWLYLEQPASTPKANLVKPDSLLLAPPFILTQPQPLIQIREFSRYRGFLPKGEFVPVRILLVQIELPNSLSLSKFGYSGPIKP